MPTLRDDPAWRQLFGRIDAREKADQLADAQRWRSLSPDEKLAEMAGAVRRWRGCTAHRVVTAAVRIVKP